MCNHENCGTKEHHQHHQPALPVMRVNRKPVRIVNTSGPKSVRLEGKTHGLFVVEDGFVTAMSGAVVIIKKGRIIANAGSTIVVYPGVEIVKSHKTSVILLPTAG